MVTCLYLWPEHNFFLPAKVQVANFLSFMSETLAFMMPWGATWDQCTRLNASGLWQEAGKTAAYLVPPRPEQGQFIHMQHEQRPKGFWESSFRKELRSVSQLVSQSARQPDSQFVSFVFVCIMHVSKVKVLSSITSGNMFWLVENKISSF